MPRSPTSSMNCWRRPSSPPPSRRGSKLNISKLAEQMGVSTSPVTRAVERLEENGLVTAVRSSDSKYRRLLRL